MEIGDENYGSSQSYISYLWQRAMFMCYTLGYTSVVYEHSQPLHWTAMKYCKYGSCMLYVDK